jgi:hypothetical protein
MAITPFEGKDGRVREFTVVAPDGQTIRVRHVKTSCQEHNLNQKMLFDAVTRQGQIS